MQFLFLFSLVLSSVISQSCLEWESEFRQTTSATGQGTNKGKMAFDWTNSKFSVTFGSPQTLWSEVYEFNAAKGYTQATGDLQTRSSIGSTCNPVCSINRITSVMPPMSTTLSGFHSTGAQDDLKCTIYTPSQKLSDQIISSFSSSAAGQVCKMTFKDGRVFVFDQATFKCRAQTITKPSGCVCNSKMDIWINVDHSSSISDASMTAFKNFVQTFLDKLIIGPNDINVGMSYFNDNVGVQFNITGSRSNINSGMGQWYTNCSTLSPPFSQFSCQKDGTATATSIQGWGPKIGARDFFYNPAYSGSVRNVPKMFITLTDGAMNMKTNQDKGIGGCRFSACTVDLSAAMSSLRTTHNSFFPSQTLTTVAMGIGAECSQNPPTLCLPPGCSPTCNDINLNAEHLATLAEGDSNRWFKTTSFSNIASELDRLVLLACPVTNDVVQETCQGSCCGLCVCGECKPPSFCDDDNLCDNWALGSCCNKIAAPLSAVCPVSNKCTIASCDASIRSVITGELHGKCSYTPVDCSGFTSGCTTYDCKTSTGKCTEQNKTACPPLPCTWGDWSQWTGCPVTCGSGTVTRTRSQNQTELNGGGACVGSSFESNACDRPCCVIDCVHNRWTSWGPTCPGTYQCGVGSSQTRSRTINSQPVCGGAACEELSQSKTCPPCPNLNCIGTNSTTTCNCDTNTTTTTFTITQQQSGTGTACAWTDKTTWVNPCPNRDNCPVDCIDEWSSWTLCDCKYHTQSRDYSIYLFPKNGGQRCSSWRNSTSNRACEPLPEQNCLTALPVCDTVADCLDDNECNFEKCELQVDGLKHCIDYTVDRVCPSNLCYSSNPCDRTRGCLPRLKSIGSACPSHTNCNPAVCDPTGNAGAGSCSYTLNDCATINAAETTCQRWACTLSSGSCTTSNRTLCPAVDCVWNEWGSWSSCTKSCGGGQQTQVRTIGTQSQDGGLACPGSSSNTTACNTQCCVSNCSVRSWTSWTSCTACDNSTVTRTRSQNIESCGGVSCGDLGLHLAENRTCPCNPADCVDRNVTSGCFCDPLGLSGTRNKTYEIIDEPVSTGAPCAFPDGFVWVEDCTPAQIDNCPKPCNQTLTNWSLCDCFDNVQEQMYIIHSLPGGSPAGTPCDNPRSFNSTRSCVPEVPCPNAGPKCINAFECSDENKCTIDRCIPVVNTTSLHCNWNQGLDCVSNNTCLTGLCSAGSACITSIILPETACPPANLCEISVCNVSAGLCQNLPVDCGFKTVGCQQYDCNVTNGVCEISNRTTCPAIPCTYDDWSDWTSCTLTCANGTQTRTREINQTAQDGGAECVAPATQNQPCNDVCCRVDCVMTEWTPWDDSVCNLCNASNQTRSRVITTADFCNGTVCGDVVDNSLPCILAVPVDCIGANSTGPCNCSVNGTEGTRTQTYIVSVARVCAGKACPQADGDVLLEACPPDQVTLCPRPCQDRFTNWSKCDCYNNTQWREYIIDSAPENGGVVCTYPVAQVLFENCVIDPLQECPNLGPTCVTKTDCDDNLACTIDKCLVFTPPSESNANDTYHCDWEETRVCNDSSVCTSDYCHQINGCVFDQILFCDDLNNCTNDFCDPVLGCQHTEVVCPDYDDCNLAFCDPTTGCGFVQLTCNTTVTNDTCLSTYCDANWTTSTVTPAPEGPCTTVNVCGLGALIGGLTAGIIAAIIVAAILAFCLCSGGAIAATTALGNSHHGPLTNNPLYVADQNSAVNPLFGNAGGHGKGA